MKELHEIALDAQLAKIGALFTKLDRLASGKDRL
jgi:hypothetical protein